MANLYEIDRAIMACCDFETGEIIDQERLDALQMERDEKIEAVALWVKNLESDALAYNAEKKAFAEREAAAIRKADSLKKWLANALDGQKFNTSKCAVSFRRSNKVEVTDLDSIPKEYMRETVTFEPDKVVIKELLKIGVEVSGCRLVEAFNTQIK